MDKILKSFSAEAIIPYIDYNRDDLTVLAAKKSGKKIFIGEDVNWVKNNPYSWLDAIFHAEFKPENTEKRIKEIIELIKLGAAPTRWTVGPTSSPDDLPDILAACGFEKTQRRSAMAINLTNLQKNYKMHSNLEIKAVNNLKLLKVWFDVVTKAMFHRDMNINTFLSILNEPNVKYYLAYFNGKPAGTSILFLSSGVAGMYCVSTLPGYRNKGIGKAVTMAGLMEAKKTGYSVGLLHASEMGEIIYKKMGFIEVCKFNVLDFKV